MKNAVPNRFTLKALIALVFILTIISGFLIGFMAINYYKDNVVKDKSSIEQNKQVIDELSLLIGKNQELITQYDVVREEVTQLKSSYTANQTIKNSIKDYELIIGDKSAKGPGVILEIDIDIAQYWFIDVINELFNLDAETIEVNNIRITPDTFILQNSETNQISINSIPIDSPYTFKAIGNPNTLYQGLTNSTGIIQKIKHSFVNRDNMVQLSIANDITL